MSVRTALKQNFTPELRLDTHPETRLDFDQVRQAARERYDRPFLLVDPQLVRTKTRRFKAAMPRVHPHYAVKANPHPEVLRTLIGEDVAFEIASISELDLLLELGVPVADIYYSNPMKSRAYLEYAAAKGVEWYVLDSVEELRKIVSVKADAKLYLRIDTPNIGSDWPLAGKFGTHAAEIKDIINEAAAIKADLAGVTFHVGSQCRNPQNWRVGIERATKVFADMRQAGLSPRLLNIGGGYPFLAERYERRSVLITSNLVFSEWDKVFQDPMTTACAIDRLVHHAVILELSGPSYRAQAAKHRADKPEGE